MQHLTITISITFLLFVFPTLGMSASCVDGGCHEKLTSTRYQHGPVSAEPLRPGSCTMCHQPAGQPCSKKKGGRFTMQTKDMCLKCHGQGTGTQHSTGKSNCLKCHDPHGSDTSPQFLRK